MSYCADPRNHRSQYWWSDAGRFTHFDWRRRRIIPSRTAWVQCIKCHRQWGTTNKELVATLPTQRPVCAQHDWFYHSNTRRLCRVCGAIQDRELP